MRGTFVHEHAKSLVPYDDVVVISLFPHPRYLFRIFEYWRDGVRIFEIRCAGFGAKLYASLTGVDSGPASLGRREGIKFLLKRLLALPRSFMEKLFHFLGAVVVLRRLAGEGWRPDVIHAHVYKAGIVAWMLARLLRVPFLITEHWSALEMSQFGPLQRAELRFAMNRANAVLPVCDHMRRTLEELGVRNRFFIVPNAIDPKLFRPAPRGRRKNGAKEILLVASQVEVKGVDVLLKALALLDDTVPYHLTIVGDGAKREEHQDLAHRLGLGERVTFAGFAPKEEVARRMRRADFFVLPSLFENLPCVLLEAFASGLPAVATRVGGVPDVLKPFCGILVEPKDPKGLAEAISRMLHHHADYSPERIRGYACRNFSAEAVGRKLDSIYRLFCDDA